MRIAIFGSMDLPPQDDLQIDQLDIKTWEQDPEISYDQIIVSLSLSELEHDQIPPMLIKLKDALKNMGGELLLHIPNIEYASKQFFTNRYDFLTQFSFYGTELLPFRSCATLLIMRALLEQTQFVVRSAHESYMAIKTEAGVVYNLPIHTLLAVKYELPADPDTAEH